jgi:uroporphyrinogen decarboxylase
MSRELKNDLLLRALAREPTERTPVWLMRQAGRYLPEYRATREKAGSFIKLMSTPELACEVTLQPLDRYGLDAAILFSDILTIPHAMGLGLHFVEGEGPKFERPLRTRADVERLAPPDPERDTRYVMDAVRLIRRELAGRVPLIGFAGSPWTLMCYMVEGGGSELFAKPKAMLRDDPATSHRLLGLLADSVAAYLNAQIAAGAQAVMLFDSWGGVLTPYDYREYSLQQMQRVVSQLARNADGRRVPVIVFTKGGRQLEALADIGADCVGLDWTTDIGRARKRVGDKVALQGNLDPALLYASSDAVRAEVAHILHRYGAHPGHVFNLGHGIGVGTPVENVAALVDAVRTLSPGYHAG